MNLFLSKEPKELCKKMNRLLIRNGHVVDPANNVDEIGDILIVDGNIAQVGAHVGSHITQNVNKVIDASNLTVTPGLIDIHVHLREPGYEHKETIATGTAAAAAGGFTTVVCMANTSPVIDTPEKIRKIYEIANRKLGKAKEISKWSTKANVYPVGSITKALAGEELTDIRGMLNAGAVGISDDGVTVMNSSLMRDALTLSAELDFPVMVHCEEHTLNADAVMNLGATSRKLKLTGSPNAAEDIIVARDILLAEMTGGHIHILHVSTEGAVELVRWGKQRGVNVTAEACPHHWILTDDEVEKQGTNAKMHPPLRTKHDVNAVLEGLRDGTIDAIATDHAPHTPDEKALGMVDAPNGIIGLETCLPLVITYLVDTGILSLKDAVAKLTHIPADIVGISRGTLSVGAVADVTIINTRMTAKVDIDASRSKSRNSPFNDWELKGFPVKTIREGIEM